MTRSATVAQLAALAAPRRLEFFRVLVENPDGVMTDLRAVAGRNWCLGATLDETLDQPVNGATVRLRRDHGALSLSPTRTDSTINRDAMSAYAPFLDVSRVIYVEVALLDPAVATVPAAGDWQRLFHGTIDDVDPASPQLVIAARDLGARVADTTLEEPAAIVVEGGTPMAMEDVIGVLLSKVPGAPISLYTPVSPGYLVTRFGYQRESVFDAIQRLVQSIGWDCRYRWDSATSAFRLTLSNPPRSKTVPDYTLGPSRYTSLRRFKVSRTSVRNRVKVFFTSPFGFRDSVLEEDVPSQDRYGIRPIIIEEAGDSAINTSSEASTLALALLADLKAPSAEQEAELPQCWPLELGDLVRFSPNGVHYDTNQDLAIVGITRNIGTEGLSKDTLVLRGAPAGAYRAWLKRGGTPGAEKPASPASLGNIRRDDGALDVTYYFARLGAIAEVWAGYLVVPATEAEPNWGAVAAVARPLPATQNDFTVPYPADGEMVLVQLEACAIDLQPGDIRRMTITAVHQVPHVDLDDIETATVGTQWWKITERGIPVSLVDVQTQLGELYYPFTAPTRGPGAVSLVRGGVLGAGEYEHDVLLDPERQSWIMPRLTLANGAPPIVLGPFGFDRNKVPKLISVIRNGTQLTITGDSGDTKSVRVADKFGTWEYWKDGNYAVIDVALVGTNAVAGLAAGSSATYTVIAYGARKADVTGATPKATQDVLVSGPSAPASLATIVDVQVSAPAVGDNQVSIAIQVSAVVAGWTVVVALTENTYNPSAEPSGDYAATLSPSAVTPTTSLTAHLMTSAYPRVAGGSDVLEVYFIGRVDLLDSLGVVQDTQPFLTGWSTPAV